MIPALGRRDEEVHPYSKKRKTDAVSGKEPRENEEGGKLDEQIVLGPAHTPERQRTGGVEEEQYIPISFLNHLFHVKGLAARRDIPVDEAHVIPFAVLPHVGK